MFPLKKAELVEALDTVQPLTRVIAREVQEEKLTEEQLDSKQTMIFKFLKQQYLKCFKVSQDQKFIAYLKFLEGNFELKNV
jgi:hypothetical protein